MNITEKKQGHRYGEKSYDITYMWNQKKIIQINLFIQQKQTQRMNLWPGEREGQTGSLGWTGTHSCFQNG